MSRWHWVLPAALALAAGCVNLEKQPIALVQPPGPSAKAAPPIRQVSTAPATEASARRLTLVGQRLILANPEIGLRPAFVAPGVTEREVFHKGGALGGCVVAVSEGMIRVCPGDAELAAVVALELAKLMLERRAETLVSGGRDAELPSPVESIGTDSGGTFGPSDGTRLMELAMEEKRREAAKKAAPPRPSELAARYLTRAGYDAGALGTVQPLLPKDDNPPVVDRQILLGTRR